MHEDSIRKSAIKATRIAIVIYTLVKQVFYMSLFESIYWLPRTYANVIMLIAVFGLTYKNYLSKKQLSWIIPISLSITEIILVASFGGDRLTYIFLIGCALVSLLYMDVTGLFITTVTSCVAAGLCLFVFGYTLIGEAYEFADDVFNFAGLAVVDFLIFLIGKYGIGALAKSKQDVEQALLETQAANQAKSKFLATMSHEIRTPMNAILGIAQIQLRENDIPDKYADAFDKIHNSGNALLGIINDILDLSKIETGKLELHPSEYDIAGLINDTAQLNAVRIGQKPIEFIVEVDSALPCSLYGDELRLKQILNNLLSNSVKYTESGYVKFIITAEQDNEHSDYEITLTFKVEDTGRGMKPEDTKRLFTEYIRFDADANRYTEGTGLGLVITKNLVEMMSGTIEVQSVYGKGSSFTVTVAQKIMNRTPIGDDTAARLRNFHYNDEKRRDRRREVRNIMPYGSVLVVDDVESNLHVAEGLLSPYKLKIDTAYSGYAALEKIAAGNTYDIIFMDHMMPGMDGIEATEKLRKQGYKGVIIALTANALAGNDKMFKGKGFDGFISKPIDIRRLDAMLGKYVRDAHPEQASMHASKYIEQEKAGVDIKLIRLFIKEASKAIDTLNDSRASGDIKLFTITVHSMKSALAGVGESEASSAAAELEKAGAEGDISGVCDKIDSFINALKGIIKKYEAEYNISAVNDDTPENANCAGISASPQIIDEFISACENYDSERALEILDGLRDNNQSSQAEDILDCISTAIYLDSDFEEAIRLVKEML